jgi:hypothetical protein
MGFSKMGLAPGRVPSSAAAGSPLINEECVLPLNSSSEYGLLRDHSKPETDPVTHFGTFACSEVGICPHASGISAVATRRSVAMSLSSQ